MDAFQNIGCYPSCYEGCYEPNYQVIPCHEARPDFHRPQYTREARLNAATGSAGPLPIITTLLASPMNVVSTAIDTAGMGNTNNLLTFTGIISLPLGISVTLNFQIQRVVDNGFPLTIGPTYTFSTTAVVLESEAFSFQFMDANAPEGYYTYSVSVSTNSIIDVTPGATVNATLSVLAVAV